MTNSQATDVGIAQYTTDLNYNNSLQSVIDSMIARQLRPASLAVSNATPRPQFWFVPQLHGVYYPDYGGFRTNVDTPDLRPPTGSEIKMMVNLALAYGANGVIPYPYGTQFQASYKNSHDAYFAGLVSNVPVGPYYKNHWSDWAQFPISNGMKGVKMGYSEKWDSLRAVFANVQLLGPTLLSLTWNGAKSWNSGITTPNWIGGTYVTAVSTGDPSGQTYVETGRFTWNNSTYLFVVNRRVLSSENRNIAMTLNTGGASWEISDVASGNIWIVGPSGSFTDTFQPAQGKLYKISSATLVNSITVPSGATLTIYSGATVNLNGHSIVSTGGTIAVQSGANVSGARLQNVNTIVGLYPTIQATLNAATSGQTVYLPNSTYNENVSATNISNLTVTGAGVNSTTITGTLTFNNCSNLQLWSTFWCWGENLYYINLGNFDSYVAGTSSTTGIALYSCTGFDQSGIVNYCSTGLFASGSSGLVQDGADFISNNTSVAASTGSNVQVGDNQGVGPKFCTSGTYDFDSEHRSSINAYQCYYQNGTPRYYTSFGGTVGIYGPNHGCTGQSMSGHIANMQKKLSSTVPSQIDDPAEAAFSQIDTSYFGLLRTIKDETRKNGLSNNGPLHDQYLGVINDFKKFIKNNPQSPLAIVALSTAANGFGVFGDYDEMRSFLNEIMTDTKLANLKDAAREFMVDYYRNTNDYDSAIGAADAFVNECKNDSDLVADVMLKKGLILHYNKKMTDNAAACFSAILNNYPGSGAARFAQNELQSMNSQVNESAGTTLLAVSRGITLTNYPNPFNPTTTIAYQIPTDGHVTIKVFDILGKDVRTLVDEFKPAGSYTVQFDASHLASGIYFYSIHAGEYTALKKMLLLK